MAKKNGFDVAEQVVLDHRKPGDRDLYKACDAVVAAELDRTEVGPTRVVTIVLAEVAGSFGLHKVRELMYAPNDHRYRYIPVVRDALRTIRIDTEHKRQTTILVGDEADYFFQGVLAAIQRAPRKIAAHFKSQITLK